MDGDAARTIEEAYLRQFPSLWALRYKTIKGKPTTFVSTDPHKHRPWQQQILDDTHKNKVVEKSRQLGISEVGLTEALHFLIMNPAVKAMYIFPTDKQMQDFSKSRIDPVLQSSDYFRGIVDPKLNSVSTKKLNDSFFFMRSGWGSSLGEGADIDHLSIDEYDRMKENVEFAFQEGLSSSKYGYLRRWSTPTIPGRGTNALYEKSDQMRYIWTCPHCGEKQFLTFEDNMIQVKPKGVNKLTQEIEDGTFIIGCRKCKRELDRMQTGEWVAQRPSIHNIRGYHISQMDAAWISADRIMRRQFDFTSKQVFFNYVLGEAYATEGILVTEADVLASIRLPHEIGSRTKDYMAIVAGIDWGEMSYMTVLGLKGNGGVDLLDICTAEDSKTVPLQSVTQFCAILRAYQPNVIVADAGYGADRNSYGYTQFPASWYACHWVTNKTATARTRFMDQWNENAREVTVDKTLKVQRTLHAVKGHLIGLFPMNEKLAMLTKHLKNTRIMDEEEDGLVYQRATRVGADHTVSALTYALIGIDKLTNMGVKLNNPIRFDFL